MMVNRLLILMPVLAVFAAACTEKTPRNSESVLPMDTTSVLPANSLENSETCPTAGELSVALVQRDAAGPNRHWVWKSFDRFQIKDFEIGERLKSWLRVEVDANEFLRFGRAICYYESSRTNDENTFEIVRLFARGSSEINIKDDFIDPSHWKTVRKGGGGEQDSNWKFECEASRTVCKFPN